ncbi:P-loop containing nucleoside triphosphate hydrolase protein [Tuber borchii]|uniref:P-loop containing nucleoside triphosphate hydrolase protein n=1 Tax=Tuber borchii TaxID=42251 RepID=A0A2T6ZCM8_TUBBO|nr:P-loop containing nucleoside triphosphate hydrolase protein [Tuber borchii]
MNDLRHRVKPPPPVLIAVMGKTGTGKTSFINAITEEGLKVGHGLDSCTQEIQTANTTINGRKVWLIDTPGFDDTNRSDVDILSTIADWVQQANHERKHLSGIIYFHRITDTRMEGSSMKNLRMFRELCGEKNFSNVILCTTMWGGVEEEEGRRREQELRNKENFWGSLVSRGAQVTRHRGPDFAASARKIAESLIQKDTIVLQLQEELDKNGTLSGTSAGRLLTGEIEDIKKKHQKEMEELKAEMQAANNDKEEMELLREYYKKEIEGLKKATEELEKLRAEDMKRFNKKLEEMQHQWDNRPKCIVC